jgi:predicted transcriptional regulator
MDDEASLKRLEAILESVRKGVDEAKAGRFSEADKILKELRDEYDREQIERATKKIA